MRGVGAALLAGLSLLAGCGANTSEYPAPTSVALESRSGGEFPPSASADMARAPTSEPPAVAGAVAIPTAALAATPPPGVDRKIIYQADIALVIEDLDKIEPEVRSLVQQGGGYIAEFNITGSPGSLRSAQWRVRIPTERFDTFLEDVIRLGELERNRRTSQDVTEEFFDVEARVKNKKVEEQRLIQLLEERPGQLEEILKVEAELSRVRGEIEQFEGRLRLLTNLTLLTTVTINVQERSKYQPTPPVAPSFATRIRRTFQESLDALVKIGQDLVLAIVALAPWIPFLLIGLVVVFWLIRRVIRVSRRLGSPTRSPPRAPTQGPGRAAGETGIG